MFVRTISIPIYGIDIIVVINDWMDAHKKFKLNLIDNDLHSEAISVDDFLSSRAELYLLFKDGNFGYDTIIHEVMHATFDICHNAGIKLDAANQEPMTYLGGYIGSELIKIIDKYHKSKEK